MRKLSLKQRRKNFKTACKYLAEAAKDSETLPTINLEIMSEAEAIVLDYFLTAEKEALITKINTNSNRSIPTTENIYEKRKAYPVSIVNPDNPEDVITKSIVLSDALVFRLKKLRSEQKELKNEKVQLQDKYTPRYTVESDVLKGEGSEGVAWVGKGTLQHGTHGMIFSPKKIIVKREKLDPKKLGSRPSLHELIGQKRLQTALLQKNPQSHAKEVTIEVSSDTNTATAITITREFEGITLKQFFIHYNPSIHHRYQLSINLIRAVLEQVHALGLVHRDLKPDNIIINPKTLEVKIIDYGFVKEAGSEDFLIQGTPLYIAPDAQYGNTTQKADIFSLGLILSEVWNAVDKAKGQETVDKETKDRIMQQIYNRSFPEPFHNLFADIPESEEGLNEDQRTQIKKILQASTIKPNPEERPDAIQLLKSFNTAYLDYRKTNENISDAVIKANAAGIETYEQLQQIATSTEYDLNEFRQNIQEEISKIDDSREAVEEFIDTTQIKAFEGKTTTAELQTITQNVIDDFASHMKVLLRLRSETEKLTNLNIDGDLKDKIDYLYEKIDNIIHKESKRQFTLDNFAELNEKFEARIPGLFAKLRRYENKVEVIKAKLAQYPASVESPKHSAEAIRAQIILSIRKYIDERGASISARRASDINNLLYILETTPENDAFLLKERISEFLDEMKRTTFGSILKKSIKAAISVIPEIDPTNLTEADSKVLDAFLKQQVKDKNFILSKGKLHTAYVDDPDHPGHKIKREFTLRNTIVYRPKIIPSKNKLVARYSVLGNDKEKSGSLGAVYKVIGTLKHANAADKVTYIESKRVLKMQVISPFQLSSIRHELDMLKQTMHSHTKELMVEKQFPWEIFHTGIVTREFSGDSLRSMLESNALSVEQRYQLSINLLRALKEQVHDRGILHCDIYPENIIVDPVTLEVNIIDFGLSKRKGGKILGTNLMYCPPEIFSNKQDHKSDIYSIGLVLSELWGAKFRPTEHSFFVFLTYFRVKKYVLADKDTPRVVETPKDEMPDGIKNMIITMLDKDSTNRPEMDELINETIKQKIDSTNDSNVKDAMRVAQEAHEKLQNVLTTEKDTSEKLNTCVEIIKDNLKVIKNSAEPIQAYVDMLGVRAFNDCTNVEDVQAKTIAITEKAKIYKDQIASTHTNLMPILKYEKLLTAASHLDSCKKLAEDLDNFTDNFYLLSNRINRQHSLDDWDKLNTSFEQKIGRVGNNNGRYQLESSKLDSEIYKLQTQLHKMGENPDVKKFMDVIDKIEANKLIKPVADKDVNSLKLAINQAVEKYFYETLTSKSIQNGQRAASISRLHEINTILDAIANPRMEIADPQAKKDFLLQEVENIRKAIRHNSLFSTSTLDTLLGKAIAPYVAPDRSPAEIFSRS